ncbi:hypothetical protein T12_1266 [Trichinella patagoniensis]|uniref:Uncharacterized protein n=1 Tax=Trichinella patagoniensis TaxID=990121 RepID=A0A0V0ZJH7_9BILA|nr:hypothetical protein T12_1266 [Trichinella patagoniensis]
MNRLAGERHLSFYEHFQLLIDEQGSTETLIQQVTSATHNSVDCRIRWRYAYNGAILRVVPYRVPEEENY